MDRKNDQNLTALRVLVRALHDLRVSYFRVLSQAILWLVGLHVLQLTLHQILDHFTDSLRASGREEVFALFLIAGFQLIATLLTSALWIVVLSSAADQVLRGQKASQLGAALRTSLNAVMIEQVRSIAAILWRVPVLIVPALVEYVRLLFVPFIVLFDPRYQTGEVDALKASRELVRGRFLFLLFLLLVFSLPWMIESWIQGAESVGLSWETLTAQTVSLLLQVATGILVFGVFRHLRTPAPQPG